LCGAFLALHCLLQYFTSAQLSRHFFRQLNGRLQTTHIFCGSVDFLCDEGMWYPFWSNSFVERNYKNIEHVV